MSSLVPKWTISSRLLTSLFLAGSLIFCCLCLLYQAARPVRADLGIEITPLGTGDELITSVAWGDWDGDGDLDLAVGNIGFPPQANQVYENDEGELKLDAGTGFGWISAEMSRTTSVAWGDWDGDGDLDLAVGNWNEANQVYENIGGSLATTAVWQSAAMSATTSIGWGDWDGDGDLDLAVGNDGQPNQLYQNSGGSLTTNPVWQSSDSRATTSIAWGDWDNDTDLDLAVGNDGDVNQVYQNDGGTLSEAWTSVLTSTTRSIAWGDWNQDGWLDLAVGNNLAQNQVYENSSSSSLTLVWQSTGYADSSYSVAWGDWDNDGDLDLAVGNAGQPNQVFENDENDLKLDDDFGWLSNDTLQTFALAWGDINGDEALDLMVGNSGTLSHVVHNDGGGLNLDETADIGWQGGTITSALSVAWGDWDGDGDLDLALGNFDGPNQVYENVGGTLSTTPVWEAAMISQTFSIAWGDWDGDDDLDLAVGNFSQPNQVYENVGSDLQLNPGAGVGWQSTGNSRTTSVTWGDWDGDRDLDLAVGNEAEPNQVYANTGAGLESVPAWTSAESHQTESVAWGDWDGDGDLDLAVGNLDEPNVVYVNHSSSLEIGWQSPDDKPTMSVAWGDWNGDGFLDLAVGNQDYPNQVFENTDEDLQPVWEAEVVRLTHQVAWGDWDGDGDLDLAAANDHNGVQLFANKDGDLKLDVHGWQSPQLSNARGVAWGDWDGDGDLDLAVANTEEASLVYENLRQGGTALPQNPPTISLLTTNTADFFASPQILAASEITVEYALFDAEQTPVGQVWAYYSLDGGGSWQTAVPAPNTPITNLATGPYPAVTVTNTHLFVWDTFTSGFFGQSDNVLLRLVAQPQPATSSADGTYQYVNDTVGTYQMASASASTYPMRVRGTQVHVYNEVVGANNEAANALVYRLPAGQSTGATPMPHAEHPLRTNHNGHLQGRGTLAVADTLYALWPVTATESYTLYHTNGVPTETGLDGHVVAQEGVQSLVVMAERPLLLFNLDISLEWDARQDDTFLTNLSTSLDRASELLYDVSNGQVALGDVHIYQAKEKWLAADIVVHATSGMRPTASMGGVVVTNTHDVDANGQIIENAYAPGQIRMGPNWDPFGESTAELSEEWQRALAHELSHYLLFLPDNYLGVVSGLIRTIDCQGSFMTNTYDHNYSEFLTASAWQGACLQSVGQYTTGRYDWETVTTFYSMLDGSGGNEGPTTLPLSLLNVTVVEPTTTHDTIGARNIDVRGQDGSFVALPHAQGYLFKTEETADLTDDEVIALGSTRASGDRIKIRGAEPGDRVCLFDTTTSPPQVGCVEDFQEATRSIVVNSLPGWQPDIVVTPINSHTLQLSVYQSVPGGELSVQLLPIYGSPDGDPIYSPWKPMVATDATNMTFTQVLTTPYPIFEGYVRVWVPDSNPVQEAISQFFLTVGWGPKDRGGTGDANTRAWGASRRALGAPVVSGDGQVIIFNVEDVFANIGATSLQALATAPHLPSWLRPVGQAYRFTAESTLTGTQTIAYTYLGRDVPDGYEHTLRLYFLPDGSRVWQRLSGILDVDENLAAARMPQGDGIYMVAATVPLPALSLGWNLLAYPVPETRVVTEALASLDGAFTSVYYEQDDQTPSWLLYDQTVTEAHPEFGSLVNDLPEMAFGEVYWLYATQVMTPFIGVPSGRVLGVQLPPATFYGEIEGAFVPEVGTAVVALIDGQVCGQGTVTMITNTAGGMQPGYKVQVAAGDGCGATGRLVTFVVDGVVMPNDHVWGNTQACYHPLGGSDVSIHCFLSQKVYLPFVAGGG